MRHQDFSSSIFYQEPWTVLEHMVRDNRTVLKWWDVGSRPSSAVYQLHGLGRYLRRLNPVNLKKQTQNWHKSKVLQDAWPIKLKKERKKRGHTNGGYFQRIWPLPPHSRLLWGSYTVHLPPWTSYSQPSHLRLSIWKEPPPLPCLPNYPPPSRPRTVAIPGGGLVGLPMGSLLLPLPAPGLTGCPVVGYLFTSFLP